MRVGGYEVKVDLRPISSVLPHEETIQELSSILKDQIRNDGFQRDPIIVDGETRVVLDGMHRVRALKDLGARHVVCQLADYSSREVKLDSWARVVRDEGTEKLLSLMTKLGIDRRVSREEAFALVEGRGTPIAVLTPESSFVSPRGFTDLLDSFGLVRRFDVACGTMGCPQDFVEKDLVEVALSNPKTLAVLTLKAKKNEVLDAARSGKLFPHKSTMHLVGFRVVGVNYPVSELMKERPSRGLLVARLERTGVSILEPPVTYFGRRYKERLLVVGKD